MFGLKKRKKEDFLKESFDIPAGIDETKEEFKSINDEFLPLSHEETKEEFKTVSEEFFPLPLEEKKETPELETKEEIPETKVSADRVELEDLSQKVENEVGKIERKIKTLDKKADGLTIDSLEIIDLIKLYAATNNKFQEFIDEMRKIEGRGWGIDQNIAAFYKFRVGKALSDIKRQSMRVEGMCEKVGFTPSKIKEILDSPIEELVNSLMKQRRR
jgi:flagellar motor switch/type III secretory pathway protein FliN